MVATALKYYYFSVYRILATLCYGGDVLSFIDHGADYIYIHIISGHMTFSQSDALKSALNHVQHT